MGLFALDEKDLYCDSSFRKINDTVDFLMNLVDIDVFTICDCPFVYSTLVWLLLYLLYLAMFHLELQLVIYLLDFIIVLFEYSFTHRCNYNPYLVFCTYHADVVAPFSDALFDIAISHLFVSFIIFLFNYSIMVVIKSRGSSWIIYGTEMLLLTHS